MPRGKTLRRAGFALAALLLIPVHAPAQLAIDSMGIPSFNGNTGWIDSAPLTPDELRGKTVLVDFFEYTCLNCLRTIPYLREWYKRYHKYGLEIVSVQTPEFHFSAEPTNVEQAARRLGITWPIVLDANYAIWKRYHVDGWPHEFLFAPNEQLIESFSGEGGYPDTERRIQLILKVAQPNIDLPPITALLPQDSYDTPGAECYPKTPELLIGRQAIADAPTGGSIGMPAEYVDSGGTHRDGAVYLQGTWRTTPEAVISDSGGGYFAMEYHAIQVDVVMKPTSSPVRVDVTLDGKPVPKRFAGSDIEYDADGNSYVQVNNARDYDIIGVDATWAPERELHLMPQAAGLGIYDVDFESCEVPGA